MQDLNTRPERMMDGATPVGNATLPLVSVIVVNYNYARYLETAVASVLAQTYSPIECIVIDDVSTDDSAEVIATLVETYPKIKFIQRSVNGGQTATSLEALAASSGQFVCFLDADDELHQNFVETHIGVHLCLRMPVGFSCSDLIHVQDRAIIHSCDSNISGFLTSKGLSRAPMRRLEGHTTAGVVGTLLPPNLDVYAVKPGQVRWPWSATSAIVYRRAALDMFADAKIGHIRANTDAFFCYGINSISGSAIIDLPLGYYRHHTRNSHAIRLPLNETITFASDDLTRQNAIIIQILVDHVIKRSAFFKSMFWSRYGYFKVLKRLNIVYHGGKFSMTFASMLIRSAAAIFKSN